MEILQKPVDVFDLFLDCLFPFSETRKESLSDIMRFRFLFETEHHLVNFDSPVELPKICSQDTRFSPLFEQQLIELYRYGSMLESYY